MTNSEVGKYAIVFTPSLRWTTKLIRWTCRNLCSHSVIIYIIIWTLKCRTAEEPSLPSFVGIFALCLTIIVPLVVLLETRLVDHLHLRDDFNFSGMLKCLLEGKLGGHSSTLESWHSRSRTNCYNPTGSTLHDPGSCSCSWVILSSSIPTGR